MTKYIKIKSVQEIKPILDSINTEEYSLVNYIWTEYGFLAMMFNEMFIDFFNQTGPKIGFCFPGHEMFYEKYVDILVTLDGFIDTTKAYKDNKETDLLLNNFKTISDKGIAFWHTLRNFDEDEYENAFTGYVFKNIFYPIGKELHWKLGWPIGPGYKYAEGEDGTWITPPTEWSRTGSLEWNLDLWDSSFEKDSNVSLKEKLGSFNCFFVKNSWKTRNHTSPNIEDLLSESESSSSFGYIGLKLYKEVIDFHIQNKQNLVIVNDLIKFPKVDNEYIHYVNMSGYLDVRMLMTIAYQSKTFISSGTGPQDLATYYSNANQVIVTNSDFICLKESFVNKVQEIKNKKLLFVDVRKQSTDVILEFLNDN